jgi:1,4-alpha-glucan branching enzyme
MGSALRRHRALRARRPAPGLHRDWNTLIYNHGRREVSNFLLSSAVLAANAFHIDGLRVDAVASMLYLDYSRRKKGEWMPNAYGGRENLDSIAFLRRLNSWCRRGSEGATTIAEESTAWPMVSRPVMSAGSASATSGTWAGCTTR